MFARIKEADMKTAVKIFQKEVLFLYGRPLFDNVSSDKLKGILLCSMNGFWLHFQSPQLGYQVDLHTDERPP
jgi:hypothetical protein